MKNYNPKGLNEHRDSMRLLVNRNDYELIELVEQFQFDEKIRDALIVRYHYLVEKIARSFNINEQSSGILTIEDLIQEGYVGLIEAVDKIDSDLVGSSSNVEASVAAFISQRIKGNIRRKIDQLRGAMKVSEYQIRKIRANKEEDKQKASVFFNAIFESLSKDTFDTNKLVVNIDGRRMEYDVVFISAYLNGLIKKHLTKEEADVITMSYGLDFAPDGKKLKGYEIASKLGMKGKSMYRNISQLRYSGIQKLADNVDREMIVDFLNDDNIAT